MNIDKRLKQENKLDSSSFDPQKLKEFLEFKEFTRFLSEQERKKLVEDETNIQIPLSIFNTKLGAMETICKYLKENLELSNKKIAQLLNRNSKSIWKSYDSSKKKLSQKFNVKDRTVSFPTTIFAEEQLSTLENIVTYLKEEEGLSFHEIALLLKRDDRTIWTVYNRGLKKR